jgi:copper resistance protein C
MFPTRIAAALLALSLSTSALAHPKLTAATPPVSGHVSVSPQAIRLTFNDPVFANFSGAVVTDAAGHTIKTLKAQVDAKDAKVLIIPLGVPLAPGVYKVEWHAVAADTHRVTGTYVFTLG